MNNLNFDKMNTLFIYDDYAQTLEGACHYRKMAKENWDKVKNREEENLEKSEIEYFLSDLADIGFCFLIICNIVGFLMGKSVGILPFLFYIITIFGFLFYQLVQLKKEDKKLKNLVKETNDSYQAFCLSEFNYEVSILEYYLKQVIDISKKRKLKEEEIQILEKLIRNKK